MEPRQDLVLPSVLPAPNKRQGCHIWIVLVVSQIYDLASQRSLINDTELASVEVAVVVTKIQAVQLLHLARLNSDNETPRLYRLLPEDELSPPANI